MASKIRFVGSGLLVAAACLVGGMVSASSVHFVGSPTCRVSGGTLTCSGSLAGLGSQTTSISITADFQCTNRGGNQPPGQASGQSGPISPKNGRLNFSVTATASCPPPQTPDFGASATITASQEGNVVFTGSIPIN